VRRAEVKEFFKAGRSGRRLPAKFPFVVGNPWVAGPIDLFS
jgi:hypothetical protein